MFASIRDKSLHIDNTIWHSLSVFYSRNSCSLLLQAITDFFEIHKSQIDHYSFFFSRIHGECVNIVFVPKGDYGVAMVDIIDKYFERFLTNNPSGDTFNYSEEPISELHYPNNTREWNLFYIPPFLHESRDVRIFSQATSSLIASLWDSDGSWEENVTSIVTFLRVQLLKRQNIPIPTSGNLEIAETIRSYWDYEEDELLSAWLRHADVVSASTIIRCHLDYWAPNLVNLNHRYAI